MKNLLLFLLFGFVCANLSAQIMRAKSESELMSQIDTTKFDKNVEVNIIGETSYEDYKVISILNDTTLIDTVLNIEKDYKLNFRRKDNFELMEFHNQGQTLNKLAHTFTGNSVFPSMGFGAKQYNYYGLNDIKYFYVPTPTSEFMYRRGLQQGQVLDAVLTANTSKQLNLSASYKGLRSLGRYQHELSSHGNFRFTFNYHTKNKRYYLRGHVYSFDLFNEQNGGLTPESIEYFEADDPEFKDRGRMDVNYTNADNIFEGKRYFLDQNFTLVSNQPFEKRVKKPKKKKNPFEEENTALDSLNIENGIVIDSIVVKDSLSIEKSLIKNDSITINNTDSIAKFDAIANPAIDKPQLETSKIDSLSYRKNDESVIDSTVVKDSLSIEKSLIKNDQITINNTDSITKFEAIANPVIDKPQLEISKIDSLSYRKNDESVIDSIVVKDSLSIDKSFIKNDQITINNTDSITKFEAIANPVIDKPQLEISKIDSLSYRKNDESVIDSIVVKDSLSIDKSFIKNDQITINNTDSITKFEAIANPVIDKPQLEISKIDTLNFQKIADSTLVKDSVEISIDTTIVAEVKPLLNLQLGNFILYEAKHYRFNQESADEIFGEAFSTPIQDHTSYQRFNTQFYLQMNSAYVGSLRLKTNYFSYLYRYNSILYFDDYTIQDRLQGNAVSVGADWTKKFGKVFLNVDATTILFGDISGNSLKAKAAFEQEDLFSFEGYVEVASKAPSFNKMLYQSDYKNYNWQNNFKNEDIFSVGAVFKSDKIVTLSASYNVVDNYTYYDTISKPKQADKTLTYIRSKLGKAITVGKFTLDNTIMYQKVLDGEEFFRVPEWITRNTLYYATDMFKGDPLYLQTGITFRYFTAFKMNAYNPLIAEFTLQDTDEFGNFPVFDFFVNMRVQRTRMYFKFENISAKYTGRNYYSAPKHPYRDFTFRFGLVWNFFI